MFFFNNVKFSSCYFQKRPYFWCFAHLRNKHCFFFDSFTWFFNFSSKIIKFPCRSFRENIFLITQVLYYRQDLWSYLNLKVNLYFSAFLLPDLLLDFGGQFWGPIYCQITSKKFSRMLFSIFFFEIATTSWKEPLTGTKLYFPYWLFYEEFIFGISLVEINQN